MNIRQFYHQTASYHLNGSIISAGILLVILAVSLLCSWNLPLLLIIVPFLAVCLVQYNSFILYKNKTEVSDEPVPRYEDKQFFAYNQLLITFAPAPALRLLLFSPDGMLAGEIREINVKKYRWFIPYFADKSIMKKIGIFDRYGKMQASLVQERNRFKVLDGERNVIGLFYPCKINKETTGLAFLALGRKLKINESTGWNRDFKLIKEDGIEAARLQNGWIPLEWTSYFKEANMPVLTLDYTLSQEERIVVFAALVSRYLYYDH